MLDLTTHSKNSTTGIRYVTVQHTPGIAPYLVQVYRATLEKVADHPLPEGYFNSRGTHIKSGFNDILSAYLYLVDFLGRLGIEAYASGIIGDLAQVEQANFKEIGAPETVTVTARQRSTKQQAVFRANVLLNCGGRCVVTGSKEGIEAAHIQDLKAGGDYATANGIILERGLHYLFDRGFMAIDPVTLKVHFVPGCDHYAAKIFEGVKIADTLHPLDRRALAFKWALFKA